jgi:hypothetical protein
MSSFKQGDIVLLDNSTHILDENVLGVGTVPNIEAVVLDCESDNDPTLVTVAILGKWDDKNRVHTVPSVKLKRSFDSLKSVLLIDDPAPTIPFSKFKEIVQKARDKDAHYGKMRDELAIKLYLSGKKLGNAINQADTVISELEKRRRK